MYFCRCLMRDLAQLWLPSSSLMATAFRSPVRTENVGYCHSTSACIGVHVVTTNLYPNAAEFVSLYVNHLLNESIEKQFTAFYYGFHSVSDSNALTVSPLCLQEWFPLIINLKVKLILIILYMCLFSFTLQLFRPEEIEMLVCGCPEFNMHALESVTVYDEYDQTDTTIRYSNKPQLL